MCFSSKRPGSAKMFRKSNRYVVMPLVCLTVWTLYLCLALLINRNLFEPSSQNYFTYLLDSFFHGHVKPNFVLSLNGNVWFTSQIFATTYLLLFYLCYFLFLNSEKHFLFLLATIFFYLAVLSR
jgi:hypothetical protein